MSKIIGIALAGGTIAALVLGAYWLMWLLWCWVLPQLWPSGPQSFIAPGYWLFAAAWFLLSLVGRAIFGRSNQK